MPKVSDAYTERRRTAIADAAARVIDRRGLGALTMNEIVLESGMSAGAVYNHFSDKDQIVRFLVERVREARAAELNAFRQETSHIDSPREILRLLLRSAAASADGSRMSVLVLSHALTDESTADLARGFVSDLESFFNERVYANARRVGISHDRASELAREVVPLAIVILQGFMLHVSLDSSVDSKRLVERLVVALPETLEPQATTVETR